MIDKQDALRWLDVQRDAINTEIAYAAPDDKGQYFGNLKIVNWLVDKVNEMTAVEYLKTRKEMCEVHLHDCRKCQFAARGQICWRKEEFEPHVAVEIVKRWKEEQDGQG